jgi:hypothetical protein
MSFGARRGAFGIAKTAGVMPRTMELIMTTVVELVPTAKQAMEKVALAEAERSNEALRQKQRAEAERKALLDKLSKPTGISDEEALRRAAAIINRAVSNGLTEVEVLRFPNVLCTDHGRAINNDLEPGWENTLTGLPKEMYLFWERHLRPLGYKIAVQVVDFSGGVPGDIGFRLRWGPKSGRAN